MSSLPHFLNSLSVSTIFLRYIYEMKQIYWRLPAAHNIMVKALEKRAITGVLNSAGLFLFKNVYGRNFERALCVGRST